MLAIHDAVLAQHGGANGLRAPGRARVGGRHAGSVPSTATPCTKTSRTWRPRTPFLSPSASAFLDGNKRTGVVAALVFLDANGIALSPSADEFLFTAMLDIAARKLTKDGLADLFRWLTSERAP